MKKLISPRILTFVGLFILTIPLFGRMLQPGLWSMQDFHYFRLFEYSRCVADFQLPCRWSAYSGLWYGEPLFQYYGQLTYAIGALIHLTGISLVDSLKILFAASLVISGYTMYVLALKLSRDRISAVVATIVYLYAPYRAVNVWVRGALPEASAFIFFPIIIYCIESIFEKQSKRAIGALAIALAALITTHNLSTVMFLPFLVAWVGIRLYETRSMKALGNIAVSAGVALMLSAFYLVPLLAESSYVSLAVTTQGYFDFRGHFASLSQVFLWHNWGYGGSVFGTEDGLNISVGYVQWILPIVGSAFVFRNKQLRLKYSAALAAGLFTLFLTHNKSTPFWLLLEPMKYIQFPWRFLGVSVLAMAIASTFVTASLPLSLKRIVVVLVFFCASITTAPFFREDIWLAISDAQLTSDQSLVDQSRASIADYWPVFSPVIPTDPAPQAPDGFSLVSRRSNELTYQKVDEKSEGDISFPVNYFPGWVGYIDSTKTQVRTNTNGKIELTVPSDTRYVRLSFLDTPSRIFGNIVSELTIILLVTAIIVPVRKSKKKKKK